MNEQIFDLTGGKCVSRCEVPERLAGARRQGAKHNITAVVNVAKAK